MAILLPGALKHLVLFVSLFASGQGTRLGCRDPGSIPDRTATNEIRCNEAAPVDHAIPKGQT